MFKYGSRCFSTIREACLFYRIPERDIIKRLASENDMDRLIEDLDLEDLIQVNTWRQKDISDAMEEIQDIYREYMMLEDSEQPTFLDVINLGLELDAIEDLEDRIIVTQEELLEQFGQPQELDFNHAAAHFTDAGIGHWGFVTSPGDQENMDFVLDFNGGTEAEMVDEGPAYMFSNPYPFQLELDLLANYDADDLMGVEDDTITAEDGGGWVITEEDDRKEAGSWLKFNK